MAAAAAALLPFALVSSVFASHFGVRPFRLISISVIYIFPRILFSPASTTTTPTTTLLFAKSMPVHCLEHGVKLDASRKNNVRLTPHVANNIPSDSVAQRSLSSAAYTDGAAMTNEACVNFCNSKG